jgi:hypothetical protein
MKLLFTLTTLLAAPTITHAQAIPPPLTGTWRIAKILPTKNTQCWDADRAKSLLGTTLRYAPHRLTSLAGQTPVSEALTRTLSLRKFQDEYKIDLPDLGIRTPEVHEIDLQHEDADFTGATTEVPGDTVLLASPTRIVISACGVFYTAVKAGK